MFHPLRENTLLGIGQPILDIIVTVDEHFIKKYNLKENGASVATEEHIPIFTEITENCNAEYLAGGSIYNALSVTQWLVKKPKVTTFIGCVGNDEHSKILEKNTKMVQMNAKFERISWQSTSTCAVLITNEHRTLCTKIGAANCFSIDVLRRNWGLVEDARYYYIAGFFLPVSRSSIMEIAKHSFENGKRFLMNLSAEFICLKYADQFLEVLPYIDVVFGNESEALAFAESSKFKTLDLNEIILKICQLPKQNNNFQRICVITRGPKPVILGYEGKLQEFSISPIPQEKIVDTNAAGDAFVGGFLSQFIQVKNLELCVKCGIWAASKIIQEKGCTYKGKPNFH